MSGKIYFHLLFCCGILCQGIFATLSDGDSRLPSDSLVRKRRVINKLPGGRVPVPIESVNYAVRIKDVRRIVCAGAILSHHTVITADTCFRDHVTTYKVISGASGNMGINLLTHNVTWKVEYYGNLPHEEYDGIALITVDPPFEFSARTGNIRLHVVPIPAGTLVNIYGWGYRYPSSPGTEIRHRLRRIVLPIMDHGECHNDYLNKISITEKHICTYCEHQYCAYNDLGAPLVFENQLAGIHIYKGEYNNQRNPDVYLNLQRHDYNEWIRQHTILI